jgi:general secretion pathway protein A
MYLNYFGLAEAPFSIAPAPRYLYMSQRHQEALAHLLYGVEGGGGFVLLTGEVGAGKTTVCRCLLEQVPENCDVAYIFNPKLTVEELLSSICVEFGIVFPAGNSSIKVFVDCINAHLLEAHARGRQAVLIIDEAQNLSAEVLEQMRLLTNLETSERKLLQIILIGQPELATLLDRPELKQLSQRIVARYHLGPLNRPEVAAYVRHRLDVAGARRQLIPAALTRRLHRISGGVPRVINVLCDRALLGAYVQGKEKVDRKTLAQAEREILHTPATDRRRRRLLAAAGLALTAAVGGGLVMLAGWHRAADIVDPTPPPTPVELRAAPQNSLTWPADIPVERDRQLAHAALFKAWGADYQGGDACLQARAVNLNCRDQRTSLPELRRLNRPALLKLQDAQGRPFHAVLIALEARQATLAIGERNMDVDPAILAKHWSGESLLLWRSPTEVRETLRPGDSGAGVAWVRRQLARLDGQSPPSAENTLYDADLVQQVKRFQLARGLRADGSVGPQTLIHLVEAEEPGAPRLSTQTTLTDRKVR